MKTSERGLRMFSVGIGRKYWLQMGKADFSCVELLLEDISSHNLVVCL